MTLTPAPRTATRRWVTGALTAAALTAAGVALALQWGRAEERIAQLSMGALLTAGGLGALGLLASLLAWRAVLDDLGSRLPPARATRLFLVAQLGKYVPGGVWALVTHMELGREYHIPRQRSGSALVVTMAVSIVTGALVAAATLPVVAGKAARDYAPMLLALPVLAALVHPRLLGALLQRLLRIAGREPLERLPTWRGSLVAAAWLAVMWVCFGAHTWVLARDLGGGGGDLPALATGAFAASWTAGFLLFLTPAGIGVREAGLVALLAGHLGAPAATVLAICSRLLLTAADLVLAAVALLVARSTDHP